MNYRQWYDQNILKYEIIATRAELFIKHSLTKEAIEYPLIKSRVKDYESFEEKMDRKKYNRPQSMTDIAGIRIVCFVLSDVRLVSSVVEQIFHVDWDNSVDKFKELIEKGKMGYRGTNYVVTCRGNIFESAEEYERFKDIPFEIQVRSLLDYAWGEIEHDRNYKLVKNFQRKAMFQEGLRPLQAPWRR